MEVFYTAEDIWRIQEELKIIKAVQAKHTRQLHNHSERLLQVERRGEEPKIQSLWTSYFPPIHAPTNFTQTQQYPPAEPAIGPFNGFDGQQPQNLVTGLPLDEVDVPRRGASRANSVRFDESAIQNHWAPESQSSSEYMPARSTTGIGPLMERTLSYKSDYKSDGRQSSMRSFDNFSMAGSEHDCSLPSALRPRDIIECNTPSAFDSAPAVIRCWLGMDCSYDSILYAVICTGSSKSWIDSSLVSRCGFKEKIWKENGEERISLSLFLGSASVPAEVISSHTTLPRLKIEFTVVQTPERPHNHKLVQIVLGSDILSAIKADVLFSKRQLTFHVRDGQKVFVDFEPDALTFDIFTSIPHGMNEPPPLKTVQVKSHGLGTSHTPFEHNGEVEIEPTTPKHGDINIHTAQDTPSNMETPMAPQEQAPPAEILSPPSRKDSTSLPPSRVEASNSHDNMQDTLHTSNSNADLPSASDSSSIPRNIERTKNTTEANVKGPYAAAASKALAGGGTNSWDGWRKSESSGSTLASIAAGGGVSLNPPKGVGGGGSGDAAQRRPSRSMKVLRPSTAKSNANIPATPTTSQPAPSQAMDENSKALGSINGFSISGSSTTSTSSITKVARSSSLETPRQANHTKSRSSTNVVGSATAFKWMSGKIGGGSSGGGGSSAGSGTE
ncbi:hypothetical protein BDZ91DRAFT_157552 [Kalaharituber pfeilii]|nr:hypothetical protein BDZ91DRAFT_157552 [Kalaharituber pfeilii]